MATLTDDGVSAMLEALRVEVTSPLFPSADIKNNPMDIYLTCLAETLVQLTNCDPQVALDSIQWPNDIWDLVVVLPRLRIQDVDSKDPAAELKQRFPSSPLFANPVEDGIHLRFLLAPITLARVLIPYILDRGDSYGKITLESHVDVPSEDRPGKKIVVEFSSPNLGREFDGNHLRSTIIGAYIASLYQAMDWDVCRMNFLGDWGRHIGLLAVGWRRFGSEELFETDPLQHLLDVFSQVSKLLKDEQEEAKRLRAEGQGDADEATNTISAEKDAFFRSMENGDQDAVDLWRKFRQACVRSYTDLYARLNIVFDDYSGESTVSHETVARVEAILKEKDAYRESEGAWVIDFEKHGYKGQKTAISRFSDGTTTYLLRDIAAVLERSDTHSFDKMVYVVASRQDSHFHQVFTALEIMGYSELVAKLQHVSFGKFQGLSPSEGSKGLLLKDILDQCQSTMDDFLESSPDDFAEVRGDQGTGGLASPLAAIGLMTQELSIRRGATFNYDTQKMADLDIYSGLSLHYWFTQVDARLQGAAIDREDLENADYSIFEEEAYSDVLRLLIQFPGMVKSSAKSLESSVILNYLFRVTDTLPVVFDKEEVAESSNQNIAKLALFECVRQTLNNGMAMVGLVPVRMQVLTHFRFNSIADLWSRSTQAGGIVQSAQNIQAAQDQQNEHGQQPDYHAPAEPNQQPAHDIQEEQPKDTAEIET
ncbi:hypothetical protein H2202_008780 [Exophiala xenobiotica]|nr:hypothetical protein H2202_008780 [Exophiala xenobiotica]KAK5212287.1 hypothetical protein LTR41_002529 [Exophiala xenobiotica]KAK5242954.1 hypothetical protein LTS06_011169 [Exophiala xenobiotica]KAK5282007.1 hypothetical protein LTR40_003956 [Exophiala xenobiotica]KAK5321948.1 hypothetical protein LTR93_006186 [Exophiala xenobiotica]